MLFNSSPSLLLVVVLLLHSLARTTVATPTWPDKLAARATESVDGTLYCGIFASGDKGTAAGLLTDLDAGAHGKIAHKSFTIPSRGCERVTCWDTTGIYVCNDAPTPVTLIGNDIWDAVNHIYKICCQAITSAVMSTGKGTSGQKFIRGPGVNWNAVLAYGNCGAPTNIMPSHAGGWGVNPVCFGGDTDVHSS